MVSRQWPRCSKGRQSAWWRSPVPRSHPTAGVHRGAGVPGKGVRVAPETTSFPAVTIKPGRFPCPDESHTQMTTISPRGLKQMRAKENTHCHRLPPSCHYGSHCDDGLAPARLRSRSSACSLLPRQALRRPASRRSHGPRRSAHADLPGPLRHSNVLWFQRPVTFVGTKRVLNTRWAGCWLSGSTETTMETFFTKTT